MAFLDTLSSGLSAVSGAGSKGTTSSGVVSPTLNNSAPININPVGVNLGSILAPFNQGSPENGGYGLEGSSRVVPNVVNASTTTSTESLTEKAGNTAKLAFISVLVGLVAVMLRKKRG